MTMSFPLEWPAGWPRTAPARRVRAPYTVTQDRAQGDLMRELARMRAHHVVLSTDIPIRRDGLPYASRKPPEDPGVAVYFVPAGKRAQHVIACDQWLSVRENMRAVGLTVAALRALERTGASGILDRAYSGFAALEGAKPDDHWSQVLQLGNYATAEEVERAFRTLSQSAHPDRGGDSARFQALVRARDQAREHFLQQRQQAGRPS